MGGCAPLLFLFSLLSNVILSSPTWSLRYSSTTTNIHWHTQNYTTHTHTNHTNALLVRAHFPANLLPPQTESDADREGFRSSRENDCCCYYWNCCCCCCCCGQHQSNHVGPLGLQLRRPVHFPISHQASAHSPTGPPRRLANSAENDLTYGKS